MNLALETSSSQPTSQILASNIESIRQNIIFTNRTVLILFFVAYLLADPIYHQSDIVASILAISIISLLVFLAFACLLVGNKIRKSLSITLYPPEINTQVNDPNKTNLTSGTAYTIVFRTSIVKIPFFWTLKLSFKLNSESLNLRDFHLTGISQQERILPQESTFPHRGNWEINTCLLELSDWLGLTNYCWRLNKDSKSSSIRINPPVENTTSLPILSSSDRAGDSLPDTRERKGDYYDIKSYHPSDGMRRILWKVYAKSGELFSRYPEASMTPEGQVVIFCLANKLEDRVCSAVNAYVKQLENLNIEIFFSCEGALSKIATNHDETSELLVDSVWNTENSNTQGIVKDLENLTTSFSNIRQNITLKRVLIFCSRQRLSTSIGAEAAISIGNFLESIGAKPTFCLIDNYLLTNSSNSLHSPSNSWHKYFWQFESENITTIDSSRLDQFLGLCLKNNWQVTEE
jgi:Protein of unknown function DUF58